MRIYGFFDTHPLRLRVSPFEVSQIVVIRSTTRMAVALRTAWATLLVCILAPASFAIVINGAAVAHEYHGHGALSAGASSRLLYDYAEPFRSQILDYLFLPSFGASLHMLKVRAGGSVHIIGPRCVLTHALLPPRRRWRLVATARCGDLAACVSSVTAASAARHDARIHAPCPRAVYGRHRTEPATHAQRHVRLHTWLRGVASHRGQAAVADD